MSVELWLLVGVLGFAAVGVIALLLLVLIPNKGLPPIEGHEVGEIASGGLLNNIIGGI